MSSSLGVSSSSIESSTPIADDDDDESDGDGRGVDAVAEVHFKARVNSANAGTSARSAGESG